MESDERLERERADRAHLAAILESKRARAGATEANELFILENKSFLQFLKFLEMILEQFCQFR